MKVLYEENQHIPIKSWLDIEDIEYGALEQAKNLANLPFAFRHVALMPDVHQGYGMPIGTVLATRDYVIPNAVGVDIGCGMCAVKTSLSNIDQKTLKRIYFEIKDKVPVGFNRHEEKCDDDELPLFDSYDLQPDSIIRSEFDNARYQLGTLGGGNHFIEIQQGDDGYIWIMIHSGSRNLGKKVADFYNKLAIEKNKHWFSYPSWEKQLAFLPLDSFAGKNYIEEMNYCVDYALANRHKMISIIKSIFNKHVDRIEYDEIINISHNYARMENHFNKNVLVHRKGATSAKHGELGIIPGSQGTKSFIVRGKGEKSSFKSCSHGAGRKMGRKQAQRSLNLDNELKVMNSQNILHSMKYATDLDEAAGAYKDVNMVIDSQKDLIKVLVELHPIAVIKG